MRTEPALRHYFDSCLGYIKKNPPAKFSESAYPGQSSVNTSPTVGAPETHLTISAPSPIATSIDHIVIVRKFSEIHELVTKRREVMHELESAHVLLARTVMSAVATHVRRKTRHTHVRERLLHRKEKETTETLETLDLLVESLGPYLQSDSPESKMWGGMTIEKRMAAPSRTIWESLADLPPTILDAYQPVTKLKVFRGQVAPSIDYYLTKLNLLTVRRSLAR